MGAKGLKIGNEWDTILAEEMEKPYYGELERFLDEEYENHTIFPPRDEIFTAFRYTPYNDVKVLLLGQDPYHEKGQAHGMAFSVKKGVKQPPSLVNIFKESKWLKLQRQLLMRAATIAVWTAYGKLFRAAGWTYSKFKQENLGYLRQSEDMASDIALRLASEIEQQRS